MKLLKNSLLHLFLILVTGISAPAIAQQLELVGHRGATGFMPENSIPGFKKALEFDINSIEFDVVISGDEQVVISHEPWFRHDICLDPEGETIREEDQMEHLIFKMTYEEIAGYDCGSIRRKGFPGQQTVSVSKPLMRDALREVENYRKEHNHPPVKYNVEIKSNPSWDGKLQPEPEKVVELVYEELKKLDLLDRTRIFAFDPRILNAFSKTDTSVTTVYLISDSRNDVSENLSLLEVMPDVYAPNYSLVDSALISEVHDRGMKLIPWTVNEYEEMVRLVKLGVDGIISDFPNHFKKLRGIRTKNR